MSHVIGIRRRFAKGVAALAACATLASCASSTEAVGPYSRQPVVRAYLYAGQRVSDIRLTWTMTLDAGDTVPVPINDADVVLVRSGTTFTLARTPGDSGYYDYRGSDLTVREGDVFDLRVRVGDQTVTAHTQVPTKPGTVTLSSDTLRLPDFASQTPGRLPDLASLAITVRWPGVANALYYVTVENVETTRTAIADSSGGFRFGTGSLVFPPTAADTFVVFGPSLTYYGRHRVRVFRVNDEYAQLYATRQQDSRDLNEPVTNIHGGLGVFSAFASDTARFIAIKQ